MWVDKILSKAFSYSISLIIVLINLGLCYLIMFLVSLVRDDTKTMMTRRTMIA